MSIYQVVKSIPFVENLHVKYQCAKREQHDNSNEIYVDRIWINKYDSCLIDKEPKEEWVPNSNN